MIEQIERIKESTKKEKKTVIELGLKLSEELGELSEAILATEDVPGCGYKCEAKGITKDGILEEGADVIIVALCIIFKSGFNTVDIADMLKIKTTKWENRQNKNE